MVTWHDGFQVWLTETQSLENAQNIVNELYGKNGWTKESLSAMIGNIRHESSVNPNMYEYGYDWSEDRGYGLVQWTPRSKFWNWAVENGLDPERAESQLARINYEIENNIQYIADGYWFRYQETTEHRYDFSFSDFRKNTENLSINQLTEAFMWNYEGPSFSAGTSSLSERQAFANKAFNDLIWNGSNPDPDPDPNPETDFQKIIDDVLIIIEDGRASLNNSVEINTEDLKKALINGLGGIFKPPLTMISVDYYSNTFFKLTKTFKNIVKINPNIGLDELIETIINEAMELIAITVPIDLIFDDMVEKVNAIKLPNPNPDPDPDPEPEPDKPFPPVSNYENITAVYGYSDGYDGWHAGIDFGGIVAGVDGDPIYATMEGTVEIAEFNNGGLGNVVWINHADDAYYSAYAHLSGFNTTAGSVVKKGDVIGYMGNTGYSFGTHLHFVVATVLWGNNESNTIDPKTYLGI